jgi:Tol biopolymer transport system component
MTSLRSVVAIAGLTAATTAVLASSAAGTFPGRNGDLAFYILDQSGTYADGTTNYDFHMGLISPKGRNVRFIGRGIDPAVSPNGRTLAVAAEAGGIRLTRLDGSRIRRVTRGNDSAPAWSPSGRRLAFARLECDFGLYGNCEARGVYTIRRDGSDPQLLVEQGLEPAWSRMGTIAYVAGSAGYQRTGNSWENAIHVVQATGGPSRRLVWRGRSPDWSPRGDRLVFIRDVDVYEALFVVNADGSGLQRLHVTRGSFDSPVWSPDGRSIAFLENAWAYRISPNGKNRRRLFRVRCEPCEFRNLSADALAWQPLP